MIGTQARFTAAGGRLPTAAPPPQTLTLSDSIRSRIGSDTSASHAQAQLDEMEEQWQATQNKDASESKPK